MGQGSPGYGEWRHPDCPFVVEYSLAAMEQIRSHVMDGFYSMPRGGAESGGVLFGTRDGGRVRIVEVRTATCEHALGPSFTLSIRDEAALQQLLAGGAGAGLEPVGWYHSHTRTGLQLGDHDVDVWKRYFPRPWQLALVLRPANMGLMRAAFFFRDADGAVCRHAPYGEFTLEPPGRQVERTVFAAYEPDLVPPPPPPLAEAVDPPPAQPVRVHIAPPQFATTRAAGSAKWLWALLLLLAGAGGVYMTHGSWHRMAALWQKPPIDLRTEKDGEQLLIRWNPGSGAIERATGGTLHIEDGESTRAIPLDNVRLRRGLAEYKPHSGVAGVRLILRQADGRTVVESVDRDAARGVLQ